MPAPEPTCSNGRPVSTWKFLFCLSGPAPSIILNGESLPLWSMTGMAQRRPLHSRLQTGVPDSSSRRRYALRHSPASRRRALGLVRKFHQPSSGSHASSASTPPSSESARPVLAPLQFNLRRLPSRLRPSDKSSMSPLHGSSPIQAGTKRKRVVSGAENAHSGPRGLRHTGGSKKFKSYAQCDKSSDEDASSMDLDDSSRHDGRPDSDDDATGSHPCKGSYLIHAWLSLTERD